MNLENMMITEEEFKAKVDIFDLFRGDLALDKLPSNKDQTFKVIKESYLGRRAYVEHLGFPLLSKEFAYELKEAFEARDINTFVEIEAGSGALTTLMNNLNFRGVGYTLDPAEIKHNWGMKTSPISEHALQQGNLKYQDIRTLEISPDEVPDVIVASWIPYEGGDEVIEFFEIQEQVSEYFLIIGEGYGGCTASDEFHDWLDQNYNDIWSSSEYKPFESIWDSVILYQRKNQEFNDE